MLAAMTTLPVIGVPVALSRLDGLDSLLSIVQMPRGVPVATVAINGATNAGLLCVRILAAHDEALGDALEAYRLELADQAKTQDEHLPRT
jgi:5-(carboxyamino)imidazole ribonucleotide mutase